jgi:hypothetical protein
LTIVVAGDDAGIPSAASSTPPHIHPPRILIVPPPLKKSLLSPLLTLRHRGLLIC